MDQFTYAERATDWRGNNNIAESIFEQMSQEPYPEPMWVVCGAETGGERLQEIYLADYGNPPAPLSQCQAFLTAERRRQH